MMRAWRWWNPYARRRWSDTERRWGPFTVDHAKAGRANRWAVLLNSGDPEDGPNAHLRLHAFRWTLLVELPPILKPYRERVTAKYWNAETIARMGRDWYYHYDPREFGFCLTEGFLMVHYGRQSLDSSTEQSWSWFLPWTQWRHVRQSWHGLHGERLSVLYDRSPSTLYRRQEAHRSLCPKVQFLFLDFDRESIRATTHIEEREWRFGTGAFRWLSWFRRPKVHRSLEIAFSAEVGRKKGSWKGGTIGHSIEMLPGELHEAAFRRYCAKHELTFSGWSVGEELKVENPVNA